MDTQKGKSNKYIIECKVYTEYKQSELTEKSKKNWKALGKHIIISNSSGISQVIKIRDVKKIRLLRLFLGKIICKKKTPAPMNSTKSATMP